MLFKFFSPVPHIKQIQTAEALGIRVMTYSGQQNKKKKKRTSF